MTETWVLTTQFFPPETAAAAHRANALAGAIGVDANVCVVAAEPGYPNAALFSGTLPVLPFAVHRCAPLRPHGTHVKRALREIAFSARAAAAAARMSPDVVVATSPTMFLGPASYVAARLRRARFVWDLRDVTWEYATEWRANAASALAARLVTRLMWAVARRADAVLTATPGIREACVANGVAPERVRIAANGVSESVVRALGGKRAGERPEPVVAYVGLIGHNQRVSTLVDAAARLPDVQFVIAGDGPERTEVERRAALLGVDNVEFAGYLSSAAIASLYADADILFAQVRSTPALRRDALPSKLFEYMAADRPLIFAGEGLGADYVRSVGCGIVVPPEDPAAIADAIRALASDPALRRSLGSRGRDHVEKAATREQVMATAIAALRSTRVFTRKSRAARR